MPTVEKWKKILSNYPDIMLDPSVITNCADPAVK